ncbi:RnfABCDGE type electron transport complex subunit D [Arenimonas daejeonensis]|uniref:RnfABCDGE type electron transport complex subunit D n=1 Tax=Arenimonas daejeonensis TaxID=370777 RepID=UPI001D146993|nr:RnfABCDGE type electron transport complex subunit D [Arenimonas daejeonensis]
MKTFDTASAPHLPPKRNVRTVMGLVLLALAPGVLAHGWFFGPGIAIQIVLATLFALGFEAAMLRLRGRPLRPFLTDLSAPLTAVLFALSVPPLAPWWIAAIGMAAAIILAKHLYGGLGHNLFNPAMAGVAVVLLCFPREFTQWLPPAGLDPSIGLPGLGDSLRVVFTGVLPAPWGLGHHRPGHAAGHGAHAGRPERHAGGDPARPAVRRFRRPRLGMGGQLLRVGRLFSCSGSGSYPGRYRWRPWAR